MQRLKVGMIGVGRYRASVCAIADHRNVGTCHPRRDAVRSARLRLGPTDRYEKNASHACGLEIRPCDSQSTAPSAGHEPDHLLEHDIRAVLPVFAAERAAREKREVSIHELIAAEEQPGINALLPMIETERSFGQIKMHKLLKHTAIRIKPVFGIDPKASITAALIAVITHLPEPVMTATFAILSHARILPEFGPV